MYHVIDVYAYITSSCVYMYIRRRDREREREREKESWALLGLPNQPFGRKYVRMLQSTAAGIPLSWGLEPEYMILIISSYTIQKCTILNDAMRCYTILNT